MQSPFPGMDPYLEQHWGDVHTRLMVYMCDQIDEQLPDDLQARVEESVMVDIDETERRVFPDVRVVEEPQQTTSETPHSFAVSVAEPCIIPLPDEAPTSRHVEIVDLVLSSPTVRSESQESRLPAAPTLGLPRHRNEP